MTEGTYGAPGTVAAELATVRAIYAAFARRDLDAALHHLATDVQLTLPGTSARAGREGPYRGHAGVRAYFADLGAVWEELSLHAEDIRAVPGGVIVFGFVRGRVAGERIQRNVIWSWRLRDGLAFSVRVNDLPDTRRG